EEREENVRDAFALSKSYAEFGNAERHLLLIDDVLTTGATLEAAAMPLMGIPNVKLSVFTIGIAGN
ncbi:MAG: ComF family protein, partial [Chitinophagaceae bacterium]